MSDPAEVRCSFGGFTHAMPGGGVVTDPPCPAPVTHQYRPAASTSGAWVPCCEGHARLLDVGRYRTEVISQSPCEKPRGGGTMKP